MDVPFAHALTQTLACDATITSPIKANSQPRPGLLVTSSDFTEAFQVLGRS